MYVSEEGQPVHPNAGRRLYGARDENLPRIYWTRKVGLRETHETETRFQPWHGQQVLFTYKNISYRAANATAVQGECLCPKDPPENCGCTQAARRVMNLEV